VSIGRGEQFAPAFLKLNPNHRMPVVVDHDPVGGGAPISVFESGAIMEKVGRFWPQDIAGKYEVTQWVMWQTANQGPKLGECGHFRRLGDREGDQSYAIRRFTDEANRLYGVLNNRLYDRPYLAGSECTIADMTPTRGASTARCKGRTSRTSRIASAGLRRFRTAQPCSVAWLWAAICPRMSPNCHQRSRRGSGRSSTISERYRSRHASAAVVAFPRLTSSSGLHMVSTLSCVRWV
jgi:hypothetical protein